MKLEKKGGIVQAELDCDCGHVCPVQDVQRDDVLDFIQSDAYEDDLIIIIRSAIEQARTKVVRRDLQQIVKFSLDTL